MNTLFGLSMDTIMTVALTLFIAVTAVIALLALRNPLMFKLGLRNVPRRRAQTILIVVGLMLSTVIITSALATGDTMSNSIRASAVSSLGGIDEIVTTNAAALGGASNYFPDSVLTRINASLAGKKISDGVSGAIVQPVALQDQTSRQTKANTELLGVPASFAPAFGALTAESGAAVSLNNLAANQVLVNHTAAHALNAHVGDRLLLFVGGRRVPFTVQQIVRDENLAAGGLLQNGNPPVPEVLLPLRRLQGVIGLPGQINAVLISNRGDAVGGATLTNRVRDTLAATLANPHQVAAAVATLRAPAGQTALATLQHDQTLSAATKTKLRQLQHDVAAPGNSAGSSATMASLLTDKNVVDALKTIKTPAVATPLNDALLTVSNYWVQTVKQDALDQADQAGSQFSSIFLVFGLFSIAAGIMLIFLIFVMLAAERRAEMGMARAVGTKRRHLIEQFLFEGYAYDLGAAMVGVGIGIGVGLGLVSVIAALAGSIGFTLQPQISLRSVLVAFCLGALVTFLTVAVSSWRVSRLNIVAAIRDLPEDLHVDGSIAAAFRRPFSDLALAWRRLRQGRVLTALKALIAAPWHLITAFRVFISRGPLLLAAGYLLTIWGISIKQLFPFSLGISLGLIGAAMLIRWLLGVAHVPDRLRNRLGYSLAGLALVVYWLLPFDAIRSDLHYDVEMFFLSGIMLVLGGVWTVMYNSDILLSGLLLLFGRIGMLAPVLKTAVTYPMQHRFRTGLTLSMFSLVIFTLMVMSVLTSSFAGQGLDLNRDIGGYDVYGNISPISPIHDVNAAIRANPGLRHRITGAGGLGAMPIGAREPGRKDQTWQLATLNVADNGYLNSTRFTLHARATGYTTDSAVWQALRNHPGYAVVMGDMVMSKSGGSNGNGFQIRSFRYEDTRFKPAHIQMRNIRTGAAMPLTVIGVIDRRSNFAFGLYTAQATLAASGWPSIAPTTFYFRVAPGQNVHQAALALGSAFLPNGLDVVETRVQYNQNLAVNVGLNTLLEGFMALGLVVGIAALGVVATRSVVERRQHIGILRAIGFKRSMIQASFLLESSFVSLVGTALGVGLGLSLATQLIGNFAKTDPNLHATIPWPQIALIVALAYGASLLTTYLPAWQASRIYPAEALRYE